MKTLAWCAGACAVLLAFWLFVDSPFSASLGIDDVRAAHPETHATARASPPKSETAQASGLDPDPYQNQAKEPAEPIATF